MQWAALVANAQDPASAKWDDSLLIARLERSLALDSLAAGRERWKRSGVVEYRLETHYECFCVPPPEAQVERRMLLTIRNGRVVARQRGKTTGFKGELGTAWTVDSLFNAIAEDLQEEPRGVRRLKLHPRYGVPMGYEAYTPRIDDLSLTIVVDSFAVIRAAMRRTGPMGSRARTLR